MQQNNNQTTSQFTPPEHLKHFFDEKDRLLLDRNRLIKEKNTYEKKRNSCIFTIVISVIFIILVITLIPLIIAFIRLFPNINKVKEISAELEAVNSRLSELGVEYKEEFQKFKDDSYDPFLIQTQTTDFNFVGDDGWDDYGDTGGDFGSDDSSDGGDFDFGGDDGGDD